MEAYLIMQLSYKKTPEIIKNNPQLHPSHPIVSNYQIKLHIIKTAKILLSARPVVNLMEITRAYHNLKIYRKQ